MNAFGHIMLGTMDVHHQWTKVGANLFAIDVIWISLAFLIYPPPVLIQLFEQVYGFSSLLQQTEWMKERIRFMLGGAEVILSERFGSAQGITEHYTALSIFHQNILSQCLRLHPRSLQGLSLLLEKYAVKLQFLNARLFVVLFWPIIFNVSPQWSNWTKSARDGTLYYPNKLWTFHASVLPQEQCRWGQTTHSA